MKLGVWIKAIIWPLQVSPRRLADRARGQDLARLAQGEAALVHLEVDSSALGGSQEYVE